MSGGGAAAPSAQEAFGAVARPYCHGRGRGSARITLRLTPEEAEELARLSAGMSVSAYVRERMFGQSSGRRRRRDHKPVADQQAMARALALLGQSRIASNLNQLAYHAHLGALPVDDRTALLLDEAHALVVELRATLLQALGRLADEGA